MKTIQTTINGVPVLLFQAPDNAVAFEIFEKKSIPTHLIVFIKDKYFEPGLPTHHEIPLAPTGYTWRFINLINDLTEEQVKELFDLLADEFYDTLVDEIVEEWPKMSEYLGNEQEHFDAVADCYADAMNRLSTWGLIVGEKV